MSIRKHKRRLMRATPSHGLPRAIHGRSSRIKWPVTFPPPATDWSAVTHGVLALPSEVRIRGHGLARLRKRLQGMTGRLVVMEE